MSRILDSEDAKKFKEACKLYVQKHCCSKEAAIKQLTKLGLGPMKFVKKKIPVDAYQHGSHAPPDWALKAYAEGVIYKPDPTTNEVVKIKTLEGDMKVEWNDWIVRGVRNELYSIKNDIFEETYEPYIE